MNKEENTQETLTELNDQQAVNILVQGVRFAQTKGVYTLEDAEVIARAIKVFVTPTPEVVEEVEEDK